MEVVQAGKHHAQASDKDVHYLHTRPLLAVVTVMFQYAHSRMSCTLERHRSLGTEPGTHSGKNKKKDSEIG